MTSPGRPTKDQFAVADERGNPFVTFSRLVDQQMSSLFRNMLDFPNSFGMSRSSPDTPYHSPASADEQRRWQKEAEDFEKSINEFFGQHQENKQEEEAARRRREQSMRDLPTRQSSQKYTQGQQHDPCEETDEACRIMDCVREAFAQMESNDESEDPPQRCPYDPQLRCPYRPATEEVPEDESPTTHAWSNLPPWRRGPVPSLVDYIDENPYSPLHLEDRHPFCEHGAKWRRAFADLLAVQHGVDAPPEDQHEEMSKQNWLLALPIYLASQQDVVGGNATKEPQNDAEEDTPTELDLYKHFLGARSPGVESTHSTQATLINVGAHEASSQPSVISTMTTTQRTTRPDGSVYTQVVLKKRFADGREESTETEHTTHGTKRPNLESTKQSPRPRAERATKPTPALGYDGKVKQAIGQRLEEKKKNGWFWS